MANPIIVPANVAVTFNGGNLYDNQAVDLKVTVDSLPSTYDMMIILQLYFKTSGKYGYFAQIKANGNTSVIFDIETAVPTGTLDITSLNYLDIIDPNYSDVRYYYLF